MVVLFIYQPNKNIDFFYYKKIRWNGIIRNLPFGLTRIKNRLNGYGSGLTYKTQTFSIKKITFFNFYIYIYFESP